MTTIFKSKTLMFSVLLGLLGAIEGTFGLFKEVLTPETYGISLMSISVAVAVLRVLTTQPLDQK